MVVFVPAEWLIFTNFYLKYYIFKKLLELQKQYREFFHALHLASPNDNILHKHNIKTRKLTWTQCQLYDMNTTKLQISEWFIFYSIRAQDTFEKIIWGRIQESLQERIELIMSFQKLKSNKLFIISNLYVEVCASKDFRSYIRQCSSNLVQAISVLGLDERKRNQWEILEEALEEAVKLRYC